MQSQSVFSNWSQAFSSPGFCLGVALIVAVGVLLLVLVVREFREEHGFDLADLARQHSERHKRAMEKVSRELGWSVGLGDREGWEIYKRSEGFSMRAWIQPSAEQSELYLEIVSSQPARVALALAYWRSECWGSSGLPGGALSTDSLDTLYWSLMQERLMPPQKQWRNTCPGWAQSSIRYQKDGTIQIRCATLLGRHPPSIQAWIEAFSIFAEPTPMRLEPIRQTLSRAALSKSPKSPLLLGRSSKQQPHQRRSQALSLLMEVFPKAPETWALCVQWLRNPRMFHRSLHAQHPERLDQLFQRHIFCHFAHKGPARRYIDAIFAQHSRLDDEALLSVALLNSPSQRRQIKQLVQERRRELPLKSSHIALLQSRAKVLPKEVNPLLRELLEELFAPCPSEARPWIEAEPDTCVALLEILGATGQPSDVQWLKTLAAPRLRRHSMPLEGSITTAISDAIAAIRSRIPNTQGQLSLTTEAEGGISFPAESGGVSIAS